MKDITRHDNSIQPDVTDIELDQCAEIDTIANKMKMLTEKELQDSALRSAVVEYKDAKAYHMFALVAAKSRGIGMSSDISKAMHRCKRTRKALLQEIRKVERALGRKPRALHAR